MTDRSELGLTLSKEKLDGFRNQSEPWLLAVISWEGAGGKIYRLSETRHCSLQCGHCSSSCILDTVLDSPGHCTLDIVLDLPGPKRRRKTKKWTCWSCLKRDRQDQRQKSETGSQHLVIQDMTGRGWTLSWFTRQLLILLFPMHSPSPRSHHVNKLSVPILFGLFIADPGEASGCSTNTLLLIK